MPESPNKLTVEEIENWASKRADDCGRVCRQFIETMRENERLHRELRIARGEYAYIGTNNGVQIVSFDGKKEEPLFPNKQSLPPEIQELVDELDKMEPSADWEITGEVTYPKTSGDK